MNKNAAPRILLIFLITVITSLPQTVSAQNANSIEDCMKKKLCIGVRSHARPFSYKSNSLAELASEGPKGPLARKGYTGYVVRICDAALVELGNQFGSRIETLTFDDVGVYDIDLARQENANSRTQTEPSPPPENLMTSRLAGIGKIYDILCDPTTITNERKDNHFVSPPVFLTGISYITRSNSASPREACSNSSSSSLFGMVGGTTAKTHGLRALLNADELPQFSDELEMAVSSIDPCNLTTSTESTEATSAPLIKFFPDHKSAAQAFCNKEFYFYIGDLELITENARTHANCPFDNGVQTFTNDRYAIFARAIEAGTADEYIRRKARIAEFFEILSRKILFNPSIIDDAFDKTFGGRSPSRKLSIFFWSIRGERSN